MEKPILFGGAILLLVLIPTIVFSLELTSLKSSFNSVIAKTQDEIEKIETKNRDEIKKIKTMLYSKNQDEIEKIETKLDALKEEKEKISSRLDFVPSGEDGE